MKISNVIKSFVLMACLCMTVAIAGNAKAAGYTVTSDKATGTVNITVTDAAMTGAEAAVVCYSPAWNGSSDLTDSSVVYIGQKKAGAATFSFKINKAAEAGNYTVVMSAGNKDMVKFAFEQNASNPGNNTSTPSASSTKLKAPKIAAKAKGKKVTVSWKKIKNAKGYKVYMSNKKKGKYKVKATIKKAKTVKWTKKLKKGTYFIKMKAYTKSGKKTVYSKFSNVKKVVIKK